MKYFINAVYILLGVGFLSYGTFLVWERNAPIPAPNTAGTKPTRNQLQIALPSVNILLPVYPAQIYGTRWETTKLGVSYLSTSPKPGDIGNSVLYGHNWPNLLRRLHQVKPGDNIFITTSKGVVKRFTIVYIFTVNADQTEIFANTTDRRITLYTCTALFDTKRLVVTALLDSQPISYN